MTLTTALLQSCRRWWVVWKRESGTKPAMSLKARVFLVGHIFCCGGECTENVNHNFVELTRTSGRTSQHNAADDPEVYGNWIICWRAEIRQARNVTTEQSTWHLLSHNAKPELVQLPHQQLSLICQHRERMKKLHLFPHDSISAWTERTRSLPVCNTTDGWEISRVTNSISLVRERTIPTERPPLVGDVSANFCG
jgi:hypothetical protein